MSDLTPPPQVDIAIDAPTPDAALKTKKEKAAPAEPLISDNMEDNSPMATPVPESTPATEPEAASAELPESDDQPSEMKAPAITAPIPDWEKRRNDLFPTDVVLAAQHAEKVTGCPTCVTLGQWAVESEYGKYCLHVNNPFGLKYAHQNNLPPRTLYTKEFENGQWITVAAQFAAFPSLEDACICHGHQLMNPAGWYSKCSSSWSDGRNWQAFLRCVAPIYATDPQYYTSVLSVITSYNLQNFNLPR